ncbi:MAG: TIGR03915 family putative DNA repair protein [Roseburia sp.]|nr:TIGR03915 family putative DNA repair protein [Roseburia sp.]MCM1280104.1 TIGR03915 family putative DNA repair protein [Robinsoniella sp.]
MGTILLCEDSLEGVFTGIYKAYQRKENHKECKVLAGGVNNYELFAQYVEIKPEDELAEKVSRTICRDLGMEAYRAICQALAAEDDDKADAVYHTVVEGLKQHGKGSNGLGQETGGIMGNLTNPYIRKVFELSRSTEFEIMRIKQFLRFQELENGILYAKVGPKCNILSFIAPHFADRLPLENFVIHDDKRQIFIVHPAKQDWFMAAGERFDEEVTKRFSQDEKQYEELFIHFCHAIAIKERKNPALQRQMLPIRFREYMVEF